MPIVRSHDAALKRLRRRAATVPVVSTIAASALAAAPVVADVPLAPPFGLVVLLGWRLLRPDLWPAWMGVPLGLADDLLSGRPAGTAVAVWTAILLVIEAREDRIAWRSRMEEWLVAALALAVAAIAGWATTLFTGSGAPLRMTAPPLVAGILLFPLATRLCARLDRYRLAG